MKRALDELKASISGINEIVSTAMGYGEQLDLVSLSNELYRLERVASIQSLTPTTEPTGAERVREIANLIKTPMGEETI